MSYHDQLRDEGTTPPFTSPTEHQDNTGPGMSPSLLRVALIAATVGVAAAVPVGSILGWLFYTMMASDCSGDGWCELGAAIFGLGFGVVTAYVAYVGAGVAAIRRQLREGARLIPALIHAIAPIGVVVVMQLLPYVF